MSEKSVTDTELAAWGGLLHAHRRLTEELDGELERAHGISLAEYDVLVSLARASGHRLRMAQLADAVLLSRSGLTRLIDRLQAGGLVERVRCAGDARGFHATLTASGLERLGEAAPTHLSGVRRHFLDRLGPQDAGRLVDVWQRLEVAGAADACEPAVAPAR